MDGLHNNYTCGYLRRLTMVRQIQLERQNQRRKNQWSWNRPNVSKRCFVNFPNMIRFEATSKDLCYDLSQSNTPTTVQKAGKTIYVNMHFFLVVQQRLVWNVLKFTFSESIGKIPGFNFILKTSIENYWVCWLSFAILVEWRQIILYGFFFVRSNLVRGIRNLKWLSMLTS